MTHSPDPAADLRRSAYLVLTAVAVAVCAAKIIGAENLFEPSRYKPPTPQSFGADRIEEAVPQRVWPAARPEPTPWFSSNDKSRWATVLALVEEGTYVIGRRENFRDPTPPFRDTGIIFRKDFESLDKVMNPDTGEYFSSKPPLFPTLVAGEYWLLNRVFGLSLDAHRWQVVILVLLTVNVVPFAVYLLLLARLIEDYGATDFGRVFTFAAACFGTYLTTFSMTLNNHTPAACCVLFALYPLLRKRPGQQTETAGELFWSGLAAGLAVTFELPAAAFAAGLLVPLLVARPGKALAWFLPGLLIPIGALFVCNYAALGRLLPAYSDFGGPWYNYPGSYWARAGTPQAKGIDFNTEPPHVYAFHLLFGHHGWFSLTPVWLIGVIGLGVGLRRAGPDVRAVITRRTGRVFTPSLVAGLTAAITLVLFAFFLTRTQSYNYGGFTSGLRWFFWLTPLWLLAALPGADRLARSKTGRIAAAMLLGLSVLSAFYPAANPWRHPWLLQLGEYYGWVRY
jgi:hypothetical protein